MTDAEIKEAVKQAIEKLDRGEFPSCPEMDAWQKDFDAWKNEMEEMNIGFHDRCDHKNANVHFDLEESHKCKTWEEFYAKFPRKQCPDCGAICYASYEHYIACDG